jgi:hypothetical protein
VALRSGQQAVNRSTRRLVRAVSEFGDEVGHLLAERGISLREAARQSHFDASYLSKVINGHKPGSAYLASVLDVVLSADGKLTALAPPPVPPGGTGPEARERLAWAQRHPRRIDQSVVDSLAALLAAQRLAEDTLGSAAVLQPAAAQLAVVEGFAREARGAVRPAVVDIAMQWAQFTAWLHTSARDLKGARALWSRTLELAAEAGDATMIATVLSFRGYMAWLAGEAGPVIGLAQAAQRDPVVAVSQRAYGASLEARGHAMTGDADATERKLGDLAALTGRLDLPGGQRPWSYWFTPQWFDCQRGITLGYLAHIDRFRAEAVGALTAGYEGLGADGVSEWGIGYLVHRAEAHARGGEVEQACADAMQAVPVAQRTDSASLRGHLARLLAELTTRWPDDPRVAELAEALR